MEKTIKTTMGELTLHKVNYQVNGSLAITITESDGLPFATLTVNFPEVQDQLNALGEKDNCVYVVVKNYDENEWANEFLDLGLFEATGNHIESGFCRYPIWKVLF